jgi:hypothetical protein
MNLIALHAKELHMSRLIASRMFGVVALALLAVAPVTAQDNPYLVSIPNPYGVLPRPATPTTTDARVIRAVGNLPIQNETARIAHEQANQAAIVTHRMAFNEGIYEASRSPSYLAQLDPWTQTQIRRDLVAPSESAIARGDTLNRLLPYVRTLVEGGAPVSPVPLSADTVSKLNVEVGTNGPSAGLLKDAGRLGWPLMLKGPAQAQLDKQLTAVLEQVKSGTLLPATYTGLVNQVNAMQQDLLTRVIGGSINRDAYQGSKTFLDELARSLTVLQRPDAQRFLDGTNAARGNTVPALVEHMAGSGLRFAPATSGSESAYYAVQNAFVSYIQSAESAAFASAIAPPAP